MYQSSQWKYLAQTLIDSQMGNFQFIWGGSITDVNLLICLLANLTECVKRVAIGVGMPLNAYIVSICDVNVSSLFK